MISAAVPLSVMNSDATPRPSSSARDCGAAGSVLGDPDFHLLEQSLASLQPRYLGNPSRCSGSAMTTMPHDDEMPLS